MVVEHRDGPHCMHGIGPLHVAGPPTKPRLAPLGGRPRARADEDGEAR